MFKLIQHSNKNFIQIILTISTQAEIKPQQVHSLHSAHLNWILWTPSLSFCCEHNKFPAKLWISHRQSLRAPRLKSPMLRRVDAFYLHFWQVTFSSSAILEFHHSPTQINDLAINFLSDSTSWQLDVKKMLFDHWVTWKKIKIIPCYLKYKIISCLNWNGIIERRLAD